MDLLEAIPPLSCCPTLLGRVVARGPAGGHSSSIMLSHPTQHTLQPPSPGLTLLRCLPGESVRKHVVLLEAMGDKFRTIKYPLESVRPFLYVNVMLRDQEEVKPDAPDTITAFLEAKVRMHMDTTPHHTWVLPTTSCAWTTHPTPLGSSPPHHAHGQHTTHHLGPPHHITKPDHIIGFIKKLSLICPCPCPYCFPTPAPPPSPTPALS